jgi:hypothetical protein
MFTVQWDEGHICFLSFIFCFFFFLQNIEHQIARLNLWKRSNYNRGTAEALAQLWIKTHVVVTALRQRIPLSSV